MIEHIAMMVNVEGIWVDVFYNKETKEIYQDCKANKYQKKTVDGMVLLGTKETKWDAECYLEEEYGSNVELD